VNVAGTNRVRSRDMKRRDTNPAEEAQSSARVTDATGSGGERQALDLIRAVLPDAPPGEVWMGDDAAVVGLPARSTVDAADGGADVLLPSALLLTVDTVVEGIHADLGLVGLDDFGWRAVSTAVSDIAAMGGIADQLLVAVAGPPTLDLEALYEGIAAGAAHCNVAVVGGELSTAPAIVVTVSVTGHMPAGELPVLRSGASAGDFLFVTGPVGAAAAGLRILRNGWASRVREVGRVPETGTVPEEGRVPDAGSVPESGRVPDAGRIPEEGASLVEAHRRPVARQSEGICAQNSGATAMIDVSDGMAADVRKLAFASAVGVSLEKIPVAVGASTEEALCGGDDYELLFAADDADRVRTGFEAAGLRPPVLIGRCTSEPSEFLLEGRPIPECGWEHPWVIPGTRLELG